ncbi:lytic transglycosylase domain-containing protein [Ponticaulis sp.]|uniref:lytic transglycosylase domain-containing protein n=1 Tax=Ponticaulis sp. TaxID=2020902 RepID=UPI0025D58A89|nr:lytic transglycosylase domain-containing protein [Ponticaulis sp.]|tara:strand:- start:105463 stop:107478 length:2016 start_codon:yes stop_codon:yes gene_type:complete
MKRLILLTLGFAVTLTTPIASAIEAPSRKPNPPYESSVLNRSDTERVRLGLEAARSGQWSRVDAYRDSVSDETARRLLLWRTADSSLSGADFETLNDALEELAAWPAMANIRVRAEEAISESSLSPGERIEWLEASGPVSGEGKIALAEAYIAIGQPDRADELIRDAWRNHPFLISRQREIANEYAETLDEADHIRRADYLLWTSQRSAAQAMKSYLPSGWDRLVDARIALATGAAGVDGLINAVPDSLQLNPGLLYERSKWRRRRGRWEDSRPLLLDIDPTDLPNAALRNIWDEKNLHLRRAIRDDEWQVGYQLAASHGMTSGGDFAEGEFYAGWIALRYLDRADIAVTHFETLEAGVSTPISLSRGQYWLGEAYAALGQEQDAFSAYSRGAEFLTTFYGQRSAERINQTEISLPPIVTPSEADIAEFEDMELVRALRILAEAGEDYQFRRISYHLDDELTNAAQYELLFDLASSYHLTQAGVRGAKGGLSQDIVPTRAAYPLFPFELPGSASQSAEPALVIALSRQESELNTRAISSARAYGLMQMLNSTARSQARREGVSYRQSWLLDDPQYNVTLGRAHLSDLIDQFDGSYIMAIAAYNAGASRPTRWMSEYGDPRRGEIDPIDFIESIPFSETRNYVQRVLENTQVYRYRLANEPTNIGLTDDLNR